MSTGEESLDQEPAPSAVIVRCSEPPWDAAVAYNGGSRVSYRGDAWIARWWTVGEVPTEGDFSVWTHRGRCTPLPCAAPAWSAVAVYATGDQVTYAGAAYAALQPTQGELPGVAPVW